MPYDIRFASRSIRLIDYANIQKKLTIDHPVRLTHENEHPHKYPINKSRFWVKPDLLENKIRGKSLNINNRRQIG